MIVHFSFLVQWLSRDLAYLNGFLRFNGQMMFVFFISFFSIYPVDSYINLEGIVNKLKKNREL